MKKLIRAAGQPSKRVAAAAGASLLLMLVPGAAQARGPAVSSCASAGRSLTQSLHAQGVPCGVAREVERFVAGHNWTPKFRLHGRTWRGEIARARGNTYLRFRSGRLTVWIDFQSRGLGLGSGSGLNDWEWWRWHQLDWSQTGSLKPGVTF